MANEKLITLNNLDRFKKKYDAHLENGGVEVGVAKQLKNVSEESGSLQDAPFVFQATGTDNNTTETPTAPIAKHLQLRGNSVAFNQIFDASSKTTATNNGITITYNDDDTWTLSGTAGTGYAQFGFYNKTGSPSLVAGHKYLLRGCPKGGSDSTYYLGEANGRLAANDTGNGVIVTAGSSGNAVLYFRIFEGQSFTNGEKLTLQITDLTILGKEYSTVLEFNRDYPLPYYSYNAGALLDCNSQALETTGFNQWDEEWEQGYVDDNGVVQPSIYSIRSKNFIQVIAGQTYTLPYYLKTSYPSLADSAHTFRIFEYDENKNFIQRQSAYGNSNDSAWNITLTNNTHYIRFYTNFETTYNNDICIHLTWDGSRTGYEPYVNHTYKLPTLDTQLRSAGSVCDTLDADGTLTRNVGVVDLGTLNWQTVDISTNRSYCALSGAKLFDNDLIANIICSKFVADTYFRVGGNASALESISLGTLGSSAYLYVKTSLINSSTDTTAKIQTALSGIYLYYELATPKTEQTDKTFTENIIVDDFGTMRFVPVETESASNPIIPQGNQFFYPADYVLLVDDLNTYVDGAVSNLALKGDLTSLIKDLTSEISEMSTALTINFSKLYKFGNICFLTFNATNSSGSDISSGTKLFKVPSSAHLSNTGLYLHGGLSTTSDLPFAIYSDGEVTTLATIPSSYVITIAVSYAVE